MKIGIFDSGVGGLMIAEAVITKLTEYDYVYLGDTKRVPYGNRSQDVIYEFTRQAVEYLFKEGCQLIILACCTASSEALRKLQQEYLPVHYPERRILGVLIPLAEAAQNFTSVGVLATAGTINSGAFIQEIHKSSTETEIMQCASPLLVPHIEYSELRFIMPILNHYAEQLKSSEAIILGCTHYVAIKSMLRTIYPSKTILSPDEIIPESLYNYLLRHPEQEMKLSRNSSTEYLVTDHGQQLAEIAQRLVGKDIDFKQITIDS